MKKYGKRWISMLLAVVMVAGMLPVTAFAADAETSEKPATISVEMPAEVIELPAHATSAASINAFTLDNSGNYANWIDRLDFTGADYAISFYSWLEENATADGALSDPSKGDTTAEDYAYLIKENSGTVEFSYDANASDAEAAAAEAAGAAVAAALEESMDTVMSYIAAAYNAFDRDHPEVFWLSGESEFGEEAGYSCSYGGGSGMATYSQKFYFYLTYTQKSFDVRDANYRNVSDIRSAITKRDEAVSSIIDQVTGTNRYEKVKQLNKILTEINCYNSDVSTAGNAAHECLSALVGNTGADGPVCEGYARAFKVLCDELGIPCVLVDGYAKSSSTDDGEAHMWNYVQMEDGNWYAVDVTWNDPTVSSITSAKSGYESEDYLLVGSDTVIDGLTFIQSHPVSNTVSTTGTAFTNGPTLSTSSYEPDDNSGVECTHTGTDVDAATGKCKCGEKQYDWSITADGVTTYRALDEQQDDTFLAMTDWTAVNDKTASVTLYRDVEIAASLDVYANGNITLQGNGNTLTINAPAYVHGILNQGSLTLDHVTLAVTRQSADGSVKGVENYGALTLKNNSTIMVSDDNGTGIDCSGTGSVIMDSGVVEANCEAVWLRQGTSLAVSGSPVFQGTYGIRQTDEGVYIAVTGALEEGASIPVKSWAAPSAKYPQVIAKGQNNYILTPSDAEKFSYYDTADTYVKPQLDTEKNQILLVHICSDGDDADHRCSSCGEPIFELCTDENGDHWCDSCDYYLDYLCSDADSDHICDVCDVWISDCEDADNNKICDICREAIECEDNNGDHYCDYHPTEKLTDCADGDSDHRCDICYEWLSQCHDTDHDHLCDICGGYWFVDGNADAKCDSCGDIRTDITAKYTELNYSETEDEDGYFDVRVSGKLEVTVDAADATVPTGKVTAAWTHIYGVEGDGSRDTYSFSADLTNGKATVEFKDIPMDVLYRTADILFVPGEGYAEYAGPRHVDEDADSVDVYFASVDYTVNGIHNSGLYLFPGTAVTVVLDGTGSDTYQWEFTEGEGYITPEYTTKGWTTTFTMPEGNVDMYPSWTHGGCWDDDKDHWCDSPLCEEENPVSSVGQDTDNDDKCDYCDRSIVVTVAGGAAYDYCDLQDAVYKAEELAETEENIVVRLHGDVTLDDVHMPHQVFVGGDVVLDLNGHNITSSALVSTFYVYEKAVLTITGGGTITETQGTCLESGELSQIVLKDVTLKSADTDIELLGGGVDLTNHPDPEGITITGSGQVALGFPEAYALVDADGNVIYVDSLDETEKFAGTVRNLHVHSWKYTADANTITASCNAVGNCDAEDQTITLTAPNGGLTYDGKKKEATVEGSINGVTPTITYCCAGGCVNAGKHTASITLGGVTASVSFEIIPVSTEPSEPEEPSTPTEPSEPEEPSTPTDPSEPEEPSTPTDPSEPEEPSTPTDPSEPEEPSTPTDPSEPEEPSTPTDPSEPEEPSTPTDPSEPEEPSTPTDPVEPEDPSTPTDPDTPVEPDSSVVRISGPTRYDTGIKTAMELKAVLGVEKFGTVIVASGEKFPDALAGTYLAAVTGAPILLTAKDGTAETIAYIQDNLAANGTIYLLGGSAAVSETVEAELSNIGTVKRLKGPNRYDTCLEILKEAEKHGGAASEVLVCTGENFADSLSASALGKPILLVNGKGSTLTQAQKDYLVGKHYVIVGGTGAVNETVAAELANVGTFEVRLSGKTRVATSVKLAEQFFPDAPASIVLANGGNFPDGLCGGPLAYAKKVPILLTAGYEDVTATYVAKSEIKNGIVLGGSAAIKDSSVRTIFDMAEDAEIVKWGTN